jgi:DNA-binding NarL/FixJ family response regulator
MERSKCISRNDKLREQRKMEGHPQRESMIKWNNSAAAKEAQKRYVKSDKGRSNNRKNKKKGTKCYETTMKRRSLTRELAKKSRIPWLIRDERLLEQYVHEGKTQKEIGLLLERSEQAIMHKIRRLGIKCINE